MIVVTLRGGLGNQMFQYAFGRGMAETSGRKLVLDLTMLPTGASPYLRAYALDSMPLDGSLWKIGRLGKSAATSRSRPQVAQLGRVARGRLQRWVVKEPKNDTLLHSADLPEHLAICVGYWQSPQYFEAIADEIRRELTPKPTAKGRVSDILRRTSGTHRIAVHVRRGDYVTDSSVRKVHGLQSADSVVDAVEGILEQVRGEASVIVLSEDSGWCEQNLRFSARTIFAEASGRLPAAEVLALMSNCESHVIANSSLSWWGAWLAGETAQHVLYPTHWFAQRSIRPEFRFPQAWRAYGGEGGAADRNDEEKPAERPVEDR